MQVYSHLDIVFKDDDEVYPSRGMFDQLRSLGYQTSNSVFNLGTIFFLVIFNFLRVFNYGFFYILNKINGSCEKFLRNEEKSLFYSNILTILLEGYIEFIISGYLNVCDMTAFETNLSGEIISYFLGWIWIVLSMVIVPCLLVRVLSQSCDVIYQKEFSQKFGALWEGINSGYKP